MPAQFVTRRRSGSECSAASQQSADYMYATNHASTSMPMTAVLPASVMGPSSPVPTFVRAIVAADSDDLLTIDSDVDEPNDERGADASISWQLNWRTPESTGVNSPSSLVAGSTSPPNSSSPVGPRGNRGSRASVVETPAPITRPCLRSVSFKQTNMSESGNPWASSKDVNATTATATPGVSTSPTGHAGDRRPPFKIVRLVETPVEMPVNDAATTPMSAAALAPSASSTSSPSPKPPTTKSTQRDYGATSSTLPNASSPPLNTIHENMSAASSNNRRPTQSRARDSFYEADFEDLDANPGRAGGQLQLPSASSVATSPSGSSPVSMIYTGPNSARLSGAMTSSPQPIHANLQFASASPPQGHNSFSALSQSVPTSNNAYRGARNGTGNGRGRDYGSRSRSPSMSPGPPPVKQRHLSTTSMVRSNTAMSAKKSRRRSYPAVFKSVEIDDVPPDEEGNVESLYRESPVLLIYLEKRCPSERLLGLRSEALGI
ncbi:hypothetical protein DL93DRAFT_118626 [Clavulina sp. PMI_390]|nr:hypothetical protein DL93DRAFT_118626 [Clavulina sp. PMI_390]